MVDNNNVTCKITFKRNNDFGDGRMTQWHSNEFDALIRYLHVNEVKGVLALIQKIKQICNVGERAVCSFRDSHLILVCSQKTYAGH